MRVFEGDEPGLELDLAGAYPDSGIDAWTRRVSLDRDGRVRLTDRWQGASAVDPAPSTSRLLLAGRVELGDGQARVTPLDGAPALTLRWSPTAPATLTVRDLDDPMLSQVWGPRVTRLDIDVTTLETLQLTVELDAHTTGGPA